MKRLKRIFSVLIAAMITAVCAVQSVSAATMSDAKNGVVYIQAYFDVGLTESDGTPINYYFEGFDYPLERSIISQGTGFAVGKEGEPVKYFVTCAHIVLDESADAGSVLGTNIAAGQRANEVRIYYSWAEDDYVRAQIRAVDEVKDLCVLEISNPTEKRIPLKVRESDTMDELDKYAALGFPDISTAFIDSTAINFDIGDISMQQGNISGKSTNDDHTDVYRLNGMNLASGNSGGPVVNSNGEVVGVASYSVSRADGDTNDYAIVIDQLSGLLSTSNYDIVTGSASEAQTTANNNNTQTEATQETTTKKETTTQKETTAERETTAATTAANTSNSDGNGNTILIIVIAAAAVIIVVAVVIVIVSKKNSAPAASAPAYAPAAPRNGIILGVKGVMTGRSFPVNGSALMGRQPQCTVRIPDGTKGVSGIHCEIRKTAGGYEIVDRGSSCGTFLGNGQKLVPDVPVALEDGMYFYLGSPEQLFQIKF